MTTMKDYIASVEARLICQQGQIEILLGLLSSKIGKDELMNYLKLVVDHPGFGKEAKYAAAEMLRQDTLWTPESLSGPKQ
jgi:hypothetical protein